jgi:hypothetical protein
MSNTEFNKYLEKLEASKNKIIASSTLSAKFVAEVRSNMSKDIKEVKKSK